MWSVWHGGGYSIMVGGVGGMGCFDDGVQSMAALSLGIEGGNSGGFLSL